MNKANSGMINFDGEQLLELKGFITNTGEILLSDSLQISDWKPVTIKVSPNMIKFWMEENRLTLEKITGFTIDMY